MSISLSSIGIVRSTRKEIVDDHWDFEESYIELNIKYSEESLKGLDSFSHVEIIFYMDKVDSEKIVTEARHPRNKEDWPRVGIFAQRGKNRPNQIGATICRVYRIEGNKIWLEGLDAVDGTPVLDIKPWVKEFGPRGDIFQPKWISELMLNYWREDE